MNRLHVRFVIQISLIISFSGTSWAWHDKTHIAIAKAAGYKLLCSMQHFLRGYFSESDLKDG
jgi:hypothetical protein